MADKFDTAVEIVQNLPKDGPVAPSLGDKLKFYAWYKVATVGKVDIPRPGILSFEGRTKWDAWKEEEDTEPEVAKGNYVAKLIDLLKASDTEEAKRDLARLQ